MLIKAFYMDPTNFFFGFGLADSEAIPMLNTPEAVYYTTNFTFCHQFNTISISKGVPETFTRCHIIDMVDCSSIPINPNLVKVKILIINNKLGNFSRKTCICLMS